jgi:hypothetical protein
MKDQEGFYRPASWMTVYKLNTTKESNGENSWWGWNIEFVRFLDRQGDALTRETTEDFHKITKTSNIFGKIEYADEETKVAQIPNQSAKDDINQFKE